MGAISSPDNGQPLSRRRESTRFHQGRRAAACPWRRAERGTTIGVGWGYRAPRWAMNARAEVRNKQVCAYGSLNTRFSTNEKVAQNSRGLSCYRWLQPYQGYAESFGIHAGDG